MLFFNKWKKKSREQEIEIKIGSILVSLKDDINNFNHIEQSIIIKSVYERFKEAKIKEKQLTLDLVFEINESLKIVK